MRLHKFPRKQNSSRKKLNENHANTRMRNRGGFVNFHSKIGAQCDRVWSLVNARCEFFYHILRLNLARIRFEINHWIKSYDICVSKDIQEKWHTERHTHAHKEKCKHWKVSIIYFEIMAIFSWDRHRFRGNLRQGSVKISSWCVCRFAGGKICFTWNTSTCWQFNEWRGNNFY